MFRVGGIFRFGIREMDKGMAFIDLKKSQQLLGIDDRVHEIAFVFNDIKLSSNREHPIWKKYSTDGNETVSWTTFISELSSALDMMDFSLYILAVILFGVVAAGIVNTLFMSLYERMFEFGVLKAVGTRPIQMAKLVIFEAAALSIVSIVIGSTIGGIITMILTKTGIDYSGTEFLSVTMDVIYPVIDIKQFTLYPVMLLIFTVVIGLYPALHAAKITPSKAMKKGL